MKHASHLHLPGGDWSPVGLAMDTFNTFNQQQRESIYDYIKEYCNDLEFSDDDRNFNIGSEENLKQLMFGIEQRYYTTPIGNEKRKEISKFNNGNIKTAYNIGYK